MPGYLIVVCFLSFSLKKNCLIKIGLTFFSFQNDLKSICNLLLPLRLGYFLKLDIGSSMHVYPIISGIYFHDQKQFKMPSQSQNELTIQCNTRV